MKRLTLAAAAAVAIAFAADRLASTPWHPPAQPRGTAVLELFTSQGCSSCPPADDLLSAIGAERSPAIIPLAWHVDYWNSLGWSDPFSSPLWSNRQREYDSALRSTVYTPQLVINGHAAIVGSESSNVHAAIDRELSKPQAASVAIDPIFADADALHTNVSAHANNAIAARGAKVVVVLYENAVTTSVVRGENSGRTLRNDYIVRWAGTAFDLRADGSGSGSVAIPLRPPWNRHNLGIAAFVQSSRSPEIYGAASRMVR